MSPPTPPQLRMWPMIWQEAREHPGAVGFVLAAGALALIPALSVPLLMRSFVDKYLIGDEPGWARIAVVGLFGAALLTGCLALLQHWVAARLSTQLSAAEPTRFVWHAMRLPVPEVDAMGAGAVAARGAGLQRLAYQSGYLVPMALSHIMEFAVFAAALLVLDRRLGAAALGVVAVSSLASWATLRARSPHQVSADGLRVAQSALTTSLVADIESVKAAAAENWVFDRWCQLRTQLGQSVSHLGIVGLRLDAIPFLTQTLGLGVVLGLGAWLVLAGSLSLGTLLAAQGLLLGVLVPASMLLWLGVLLQGVASSTNQAQQVTRIGLDPEAAAAADPVAIPAQGSVGLALRGVTFGYDSQQPPLFADLDLNVRPGAAVALVGGSGSGKSTIVRLAIGELQPWAGTVELAGHPRARLRRQDRARLLAYVPQTPVLVPGTIRDNLTLFDASVPLSAVVRAARDAVIEEAIQARPQGYAEQLSASGHGFSGGEVQRLAIARALVTDPGIVVLDEATSALDPIVEEQVMANLRRRGCTLLMVAHRISAVRDADELIVLDAGRVVQCGSFAQLRGQGRFAELTNG